MSHEEKTLWALAFLALAMAAVNVVMLAKLRDCRAGIFGGAPCHCEQSFSK